MPQTTVYASDLTTGKPYPIVIDTDRPPAPEGDAEALIVSLVRMLQPMIAVEIGVMYGNTTVCIAWNMPPGGVVYGLDLRPECAKPLIEAWGLQDRIRMVGGNSLETAKDLPDGIGFAYIDGNHDWHYARADADAIWRRMLPGGVMVFDDVNDPANDQIPGPAKAVLDLFDDSAMWLPGDRGQAIVQKPGGRRKIRLID